MKTARFFLIMLLALSISTSVFAQDAEPVTNQEFGVTVAPPKGWDVSKGDDKAVANFKHEGTQSQIQVIGTKLMNAEVADVFFSTFHKTLTESNFEQVSEESATLGGREGKEVRYQFTHSGVTLDVMVFEFIEGQTAWMVIGYMQDSEREQQHPDFVSVIENITFQEG